MNSCTFVAESLATRQAWRMSPVSSFVDSGWREGGRFMMVTQRQELVAGTPLCSYSIAVAALDQLANFQHAMANISIFSDVRGCNVL